MSKHRNIRSYFLPLVFSGILVIPAINSIFNIWEFERRDENRAFTDSLEIDLRHLDKFPKECEEYMNDNFSFRPPLLKMYHNLKFSFFNISPHPEKTLIGSNGWYFMAGEEKEIYEGKRDFSEEELAEYLAEWQRRQNFLEPKGIKFYWMIAPIKHYVYEDQLPLNIYPSKRERRAVQLSSYFKETFPRLIIDPVPELIQEKDSLKLFYRLGNHWNFHAGKIAVELLISRLKSDFPDKNIPEMPTFYWNEYLVHAGIHYNVLGIESLSEVREVPFLAPFTSSESKKYGFPGIDWFQYPKEYEKCYTNDSIENGLRILFIRDSFGEQVIPFVRDMFTESVFIFDGWQYLLNEEIINQVKPDAVVFLGLETHIDHYLENNNIP